MDDVPRSFLASRRRGCKWEKRYSNRRKNVHIAEDLHLLDDPFPNNPALSTGTLPADTPTLIRELFGVGHCLLDPPCFSFRTLERFLQKADFRNLCGQSNHRLYSREKVALVDDRRDSTGSDNLIRDWDSTTYSMQPPTGDPSSIFTKALDEKDLYDRLKEKVGLSHCISVPQLTL